MDIKDIVRTSFCVKMKMQPFCQHDYQESVKKNAANGQLKVLRGGAAAHENRTYFFFFFYFCDEEITIKRTKAQRGGEPLFLCFSKPLNHRSGH